MKILSFLNVQSMTEVDGTQYYRQVGPLRALHGIDNGIEVTCVTAKNITDMEEKHGPGGAESALSGFDIYAYPRMIPAENCEGFLDKVHAQGGLLVVDSDDDLTEDYKLVSGRGREFKEVLSKVDYVTTSTQALADHFTQYTKRPPTPLLNCVDVEWMQAEVAQSKRLVSDKTVIGFSGSPTHWGDWYKPSVPFQRICRDYPVQALLHGEVPRYLNYCQEDVLRIGGVPYATYPRVLRQFDILLCAVDAEDKFNAGKSAVKALEAMAVGAVPICSRFGPYQDLAEQGAPLVVIGEDSQDGWYEGMADLVGDPEKIKHLQSLGPDWVLSHRDVSTGYKQWEKFFRQIGPSS